MRRFGTLLGVASLLCSGCLSAQESVGETESPAPSTALPEAATVTSYLHDLSEPNSAVTVLNSLLTQFKIPVADGIRLDAWIVRPKTEEKVPLVLEVTPYFGGGNPLTTSCTGLIPTSHCFGIVGDTLVPRGYAVGIVSVRGTGNSEGCFTIGGPQEAKDTARAIEYFAQQPWSNGHVGLMGVSYPGTTPQDVWVEGTPALKTVVPISGISDLYKYNFVNGIPLNVQGFGFNTYYWAAVGLGPAGLSGGYQVTDPVSVPGAVAGEACRDQAEVQEGGVSSTLDGNKDAYWQKRDFHAELLAEPNKTRASVFYIHGLQDWNVKPHNMEDWLAAIQGTGVPYKVWLGQWGHNWPDGSAGNCKAKGACRGDWWNATLIAWFDQFLKGVDTGVLAAPPVQVQAQDMVWRHETVWPPLDVEWMALHPNADGTLLPEPGAGTAKFHDYNGITPGGARAPGQPGGKGTDRAVFVSEPLAVETRIAGMPHFEADVTATGQRASLILTLYMGATAPEKQLDYAGISLNHAKSLTQGDPNIAGKKQHVAVDFFPEDLLVPAGQKLFLVATGYDLTGTASMQPVSDGSDITIDLATAILTLPVDTTSVVEEPQPAWK